MLATLSLAGIASVSAQALPQPSFPALPGEPNVPWEDGAIAAEARSDLVHVRPQRWDHILVAPDGQTITVYFWGGLPECHGLAEVAVAPADAGFRVLVLTGDVPAGPVCAETVQLYRAVVVLDDRVLTGGGLLDLPSGGRLPTAKTIGEPVQ
jgi:hypothetical protein